MKVKIKHQLFLFGVSAIMAVMSSSAFAVTTTGTQTFTAEIANNTCVISNKDIAHDFGEIQKSSVVSAADWGVLKKYDDVISVSNCPGSITAANIAFMYNEVHDMGQYGWVGNAGTAKGVGVKLLKDRTNGAGFAPGASGYDFTLTNGAVDVPLGIDVARVARGLVADADVTSGTGDFRVALVFTLK
ncbi:type 1 fimbrial protein [Salmonella enterica]|nr:type 1 fimbrial protein [Salmonella enterica subsp. enterica]EBO9948577.1 type 1 fimbrial protein [Salmonella enterica]